ncbi:MAG: peptidoglycan-binding protein, partial [Bryobacteraceae bacterium]
LGFDPGPPTGVKNAQTTAAVKDFQSKNDLDDDGDPGPNTREKLFIAYMIFLCPDKFEKTEFLAAGADAKGKGDYQGCGEFNPIMRFSKAEEAEFSKPANKEKRNEENAGNRRVMVLLYRAGTKVAPADWPCPRTIEGVEGCKKRFFSDGEKRRSPQELRREFATTQNTFACRFYQRMVEVSPCEGIIPPPIPVLDGVSPIIFFKESESDPTIGVKVRAVLVEKPHKSAAIDNVDVELTTDVPFDGIGTFTVAPAGKLNFFRGATKLQFNGTDNVFTGAELSAKVPLRTEGVAASDKKDDVLLTLTLSGGSKKLGGPAIVQLTVVEVTLDICEPRTSPTADPPAVAQPTSANPPATPAPKDKFFGGRGLLTQDDAKTSERAMLIVRRIKPATFNGNVVLTTVSDRVKAFEKEVPEAGETALATRHVFPATEIQAADKKFFAEGVSVSAAVRDAGFQLGIEGFDEDADAVSITVVHAEIVSDVEPKDLKLVERVAEQPERKTKSKFFPAPIIVGVNYDVRLRPFTEMPAPAKATGFLWSTPSPATTITLADTAKEVVKLKTIKDSVTLDDLTVEVVIDSDIGKFKKLHKLTSVTVVIDPVITGEIPALTSDINFIRNPSVTPILGAAAGADPKEVPIIEITKITPALGFTENDPRIAWWIVGDEPAEAGKAKYEGRAFFLNSEDAERGTKVQISGRVKGDILVQPYSGGFGYGMFRTHVAPLHRIKYRVNRIFTNTAIPSRSQSDAKDHIKMANLYLRQMGLVLVPDDSAAAATPAGNPLIGLKELDKKVVSVTRDGAGHFNVKVNDETLTFQAASLDARKAVRINARNEVVVFAYVHSLLQTSAGATVLAQAKLWPHNHAPTARNDPPDDSTFKLPDSGVPSSSLISRSGIPGDTPVQTVNLDVIPKSKLRIPFKSSQTARHENLLWGIAVPTTTMDTFANATAPTTPETIYGSVLAHELGHVLGLNHRISTGDDFPDGLTKPATMNVMFPSMNFPAAENFDIIQAKAVRFSELLFRNP